MTVRELYAFLNRKIPSALSCDWDNDGLMCCPNENAPVRRVLVALDVTAAVAEKAIREGYDVILSHHPSASRAGSRRSRSKKGHPSALRRSFGDELPYPS